ncbi:MAG: ROK family transcriptional regulator [Treponema sp.]|nr:ROK family transcriptional regulator [Treponema sp.]
MKPQLPDEWKNIRAALNYIEEADTPPTRANVAEYLSLSRTTASSIASQLINMGLIEELKTEKNGRGRPGIPLRISSGRWYALGAAFTGNEWRFLFVDLYGKIIREHTERVDNFSVDDFTKNLLKGLSFMLKKKPGPLVPLIGIGSPGVVDSDTGVIIHANDMGWRQVGLGETIHKTTGINALIMNRYRVSGLAEARFGVGRNVKNLIYIGIGTGICAAFINDGVLLEGTNFSAGEIGHILVDPEGPHCGCGKRGCLQAMASSQALVEVIRNIHKSLLAKNKKLPPNPLWDILHDHSLLSGELIGEEANRGNGVAIAGMERIARILGIAAANLVNTMNPRKIIIGGTLGDTGPLLTRLIYREVEKRAMETPLQAVTIEQGLLGNRAAALGAAYLPLHYKLEILLQQGFKQ